MLILVVEDRPEFVLMLRSLLRGHVIIAFPAVWQALNECKKNRFDLVLLDLTLQDSDSIETLGHVDEFRRLHCYNIVIITGNYEHDTQCCLMGLKVLHKDSDFASRLMSLIR